ncbi:MAG: HEPN domain-containing protein [Proteobacteria bacterium]|nr:HEPN domain-containing protein [Pseudomonadota bacterium]
MSPRQRDSALEWLRRAKSNLIRAGQPKPDQVYWEDLCYDAQQAAEKALKALFIARGKRFAYTHNISELLNALEEFIPEIPKGVRQASSLTDYAVVTRYPSWGSPVTAEEYRLAFDACTFVVDWVESQINTGDAVDKVLK